MAHAHITNDRDHKVFVFIRDQLSDAARSIPACALERALLEFGDAAGTIGLTVELHQYWPPRKVAGRVLVGAIDVYADDLVLEDPPKPEIIVVGHRPKTHEDLLNVYNTRASDHGCGFLLAGELDEAANVLINGEPALGQNKFKLRLPPSSWGYIELTWGSRELTRFGCGVTYYAVEGKHPPREAIEAAFIELLDGARPSGGVG
jgi:hypothetical protein